MEFLGEFFYGVWYWYTLIKSRKIFKFKVLDEIPFKKNVVLHLFNNECIIIIFFRKKPLPYQRRADFINEHYIIFSVFFCLVMFRES